MERLALVTAPSGYLYEEPQFTDQNGSYYQVADEVLMGWAVKILDETNGICRVLTHYGYQGYMSRNRLMEISPDMLKKREESAECFFTCAPLTDVMDRPKVQGRVLLSLTRGCFLTALPQEENGYRRVRLCTGLEGYVPERALKRRLDTDRYLYDPDWNFLHQKAPQEYSCEAFRKQLTDTARSYLSTQYRWGGKSAQGIDCSGLVFMSYLLCGILIYRDAALMEGYPIRQTALQQLKSGDLLYFPGHVAMYLGDGKYVHSTGHRDSFGCVINSLRPNDPGYREDLKQQLLMAGSLFLPE